MHSASEVWGLQSIAGCTCCAAAATGRHLSFTRWPHCLHHPASLFSSPALVHRHEPLLALSVEAEVEKLAAKGPELQLAEVRQCYCPSSTRYFIAHLVH